jgi:hypothetical protein
MLTMPDANAYSEADFQTAFQSLRAGAGNEERAAKAFQNLLSAEPGQPLLMAYAGSATSRLAVTTIFPWKKCRMRKRGWR